MVLKQRMRKHAACFTTLCKLTMPTGIVSHDICLKMVRNCVRRINVAGIFCNVAIRIVQFKGGEHDLHVLFLMGVKIVHMFIEKPWILSFLTSRIECENVTRFKNVFRSLVSLVPGRMKLILKWANLDCAFYSDIVNSIFLVNKHRIFFHWILGSFNLTQNICYLHT